jgi:hypothetical protein
MCLAQNMVMYMRSLDIFSNLVYHSALESFWLQMCYFLPPHPGFRTPDSRYIFPIRLRDYVFTYHDYLAYHSYAASLLNLPNGRAALLMGGIVWRLAIETLSIEDVLKGPSLSVSRHGIGRCLPGDGTSYWDDTLSLDQLNLICGLNLIENGMSFASHRNLAS